MGLGYRIAGVLLLVLVVAGVIGNWYYKDTQEKIKVLSENNAKLELAITLSEETIQGLQNEYTRANDELRTLNDRFQRIRQTNITLAQRLSEHEIGYLAANKPGLVQKIINNASDKAGRCFEILAGSPLTPKEKEATNGKEFNSECPWLWPGNTAN